MGRGEDRGDYIVREESPQEFDDEISPQAEEVMDMLLEELEEHETDQEESSSTHERLG